ARAAEAARAETESAFLSRSVSVRLDAGDVAHQRLGQAPAGPNQGTPARDLEGAEADRLRAEQEAAFLAEQAERAAEADRLQAEQGSAFLSEPGRREPAALGAVVSLTDAELDTPILDDLAVTAVGQTVPADL